MTLPTPETSDVNKVGEKLRTDHRSDLRLIDGHDEKKEEGMNE